MRLSAGVTAAVVVVKIIRTSRVLLLSVPVI